MGYDEDSRKKKLVVIGVSSILLVAAVVGTVTYSFGHNKNAASASAEAAPVSTSSKAVEGLCQHTDYKQTCEDSLSKAKNTSDPKELVKVAFQTTVDNLDEVIKNSALLKDAAKDPRASQALDICKEVLHTAIEDFERSFDKVEKFDMANMDEFMGDLKTWLSGAINSQVTCLDGFENTTGDTGEKMKQLMRTAVQLSSNGLAFVTNFNEIVGTMGIPGLSRKLLSDNYYTEFVESSKRRLLQADPATIKPNAIIAQDGSGTFKTITEAINSVPKNNNATFVILVKAGVYSEEVVIPKGSNNIVLMGEGPTKTKITGNKNYIDGIGTFLTATVVVAGENCILRDIAIENSAGPEKHQAVALRVSGDKSIIYNCVIDGYQDTLYSHNYRQYYRDTTISGTIDFIFGDAAAVFQNCKMIVRKPMENQACMITAQGRNNTRSVGAIVMQNCNIEADPAFLAATPVPTAYLGRPWKEYSRTIIMQSNIEGFIAPEGWSPWMGTFGLNTLYYAEYENRGPGSNTASRVTWPGIQHITPEIAESFTPGKYFMGDEWITSSGLPYTPGMIN